jgi:hypothetical protein
MEDRLKAESKEEEYNRRQEIRPGKGRSREGRNQEGTSRKDPEGRNHHRPGRGSREDRRSRSVRHRNRRAVVV